jgi:hypothetical protein
MGFAALNPSPFTTDPAARLFSKGLRRRSKPRIALGAAARDRQAPICYLLSASQSYCWKDGSAHFI